METTVTLVGQDRLARALRDPMFVRGPLRDFLEAASLRVEARAKEKAPVDTGRLRNSIGREVETYRAIVGTNLAYARPVEFGSKPHFPPLSALQPWARRHGFPKGNAGAYLVAGAIARRGTKAQPFLIPALEQSARVIQRFLDQAVRSIEAEWGRISG